MLEILHIIILKLSKKNAFANYYFGIKPNELPKILRIIILKFIGRKKLKNLQSPILEVS